MGYKREIHMKLDVTKPFLSASVMYFFYPSLSLFYQEHSKECLLKKLEPISKYSFAEICSQCLTTCPNMLSY